MTHQRLSPAGKVTSSSRPRTLAPGTVVFPTGRAPARPSINKILREFERARSITVGYTVIELTHPDRLRDRAG